jgi:hypothetical protein
MNHHIRRGHTMLVRAVQLALKNPVENDLAASLLAELQIRITAIEQTLGLQRHGHAAMRGAAENRQGHANALREIMRDLARIARVLDPMEYPDIAHQMRTANLKVYSELLARARCFIDAARPLQEVFIAYGAPVDFLARMESLIDAVNAAENRKFDGRGERINATATLTAQTREAIRALRKLEVIHANYYRSQPGLAAAWKAATHIERAPIRGTTAAAATGASAVQNVRQSEAEPSSTTPQAHPQLSFEGGRPPLSGEPASVATGDRMERHSLKEGLTPGCPGV